MKKHLFISQCFSSMLGYIVRATRLAYFQIFRWKFYAAILDKLDHKKYIKNIPYFIQQLCDGAYTKQAGSFVKTPRPQLLNLWFPFIIVSVSVEYGRAMSRKKWRDTN